MIDICDVAVIGAGPSGLTAAIRLRQMGRSVIILDRTRPTSCRIEALTPGVAGILAYLGADGILEQAEAYAIRKHHLAWEAREPIVREVSENEASFLVERQCFDNEFASVAAAQGVQFRTSSRLIGFEMLGDQHLVRYAHDGRERVLTARHVLEATGRHSGAGRRRLGPALMALSATFKVITNNEPETLVEALDDAWIWAAIRPGGKLHVNVFSDPAHLHSCWPGEPERALKAFLGSSTMFSNIAVAGSFDGVCDASSYCCEDWLQDGRWKIGDAALSLDPLSSSGVEKSMRFALQAALAVNTILKSDGDCVAAREFLSGKLLDTQERHLAWTREHYASSWRWPKTQFWESRGTIRGSVNTGMNAITHIEQLPMSQVLLGVPRISADIVFKSTPCVMEDQIEMKLGVRHSNFKEPVVFVDGVELIPLLRAGYGVPTYPDLIERWSRTIPREHAIRICAWALRAGVLTAESDRSPVGLGGDLAIVEK